MVKIATQCINFCVCINVAKFAISIFTTLRGEIHNSMHKLQNSMEVDSVGIITVYVYYHTHSKNIDKCGNNPQSASRKPTYHTKCGKNCHNILSVYKTNQIMRKMDNLT